jgi:hypothetical protein
MIKRILNRLRRGKRLAPRSVCINVDGTKVYNSRRPLSIVKRLKRLWGGIFLLPIAVCAWSASGVISPGQSGEIPRIRAVQSGSWTIVGSTFTTSPMIASNVTKSSTTLGLVSVPVLAANASRKAWGCKALSTNTDTIALNLGAAAATTDQPVLEPGDWYGETMVVSTISVNAISATSGQIVRCLEKF